MVDAGVTKSRCALLKWLSEREAPYLVMWEILSPMEGMSNEQKEAYAARVLKELEDSGSGTSTMDDIS